MSSCSFSSHNSKSLKDSLAVKPHKISSKLSQGTENVIGLKIDGMAGLYNKLSAQFLKLIDIIFLVTFIFINTISHSQNNLVSKNVIRKEIPKEQFFIFLLVHIIMSYTYAIDMVSDIYLNLFGTISNINGD